MEYTPEQYALLETFEKGRLVQELSEGELFVYQFLMEEGLLQPRADTKDGWHLLSERGKVMLLEKRLAEDNRKQEANQLADEKSQAKKTKASDRLHDFLLVLFSSLITILIEHFGDIMLWLKNLFK